MQVQAPFTSARQYQAHDTQGAAQALTKLIPGAVILVRDCRLQAGSLACSILRRRARPSAASSSCLAPLPFEPPSIRLPARARPCLPCPVLPRIAPVLLLARHGSTRRTARAAPTETMVRDQVRRGGQGIARV